MPEIIIKRDKVYADRLRKYQILIDDKEVGRIAAGETKKFKVDTGEHTLQAKIDWCSSEKIAFSAGQKEQLFCVNSNLAGWKVLLAIFYIVQPSKWIVLRVAS